MRGLGSRRPLALSVALAAGASLLAFSSPPAGAASPQDGPWWTWAQTARANSTNSQLVTVTADDTVVMAGSFSTAATFPRGAGLTDISLTSFGAGDAYVAALKPDRSGFAWALNAGGPWEEATTALAARPDGSIVIAGTFRNTIYFPRSAAQDDSIALTPRGYMDMYVAAVKPDGSGFSWALRAGGINAVQANVSVEPESIAVQANGTVAVAGELNTGPAFFPTADDSVTVTTSSEVRGFAAAVKPDGSAFQWARVVPGRVVNSIVASPSGQLILQGQQEGVRYFPTADDSIAVNPGCCLGLSVAGLAANGSHFLWARAIGSSWTLTPGMLAVTSDDTVYVTGQFNGTLHFPRSGSPDDSIAVTQSGSAVAFVATMSPQTRYFTKAFKVNVSRLLLTAMPSGAAAVAGNFYSTVTLPGNAAADDSVVLTPKGGSDALVAGLKPDGSGFAWGQRLSGGSLTMPTTSSSFDTLSTGYPVVTGYQTSTSYLPKSTFADDSIPMIYASGAQLFTAALRVGVPTMSVSTPTAGDGSASIPFSVLDNGGMPVTRVEFALGDTAAADDSQMGSSSPAIISGLVNGQAYPVWVRGVNAIGVGAWSGPVSVTPVGPPGAPHSVTATAGDASASVSWLAPMSNGGSPVTSYEVVSTPAGGSCTVPASSLSCTITGLSNGTSYTFSVRAINAVNPGPWSSASAAVTPKAPPREPPSAPWLTSATAGNALVSLRWARPDYEGTAAITEYRVYASPGGQVCTVRSEYALSIWSSCVARNLVNGRSYDFWVTAVNAVGESEPSGRLSATPRPDAPSAPIWRSLVGGNEQAVASWDPPTSHGGGTMAEYAVFAATAGAKTGERMCTVPASAGPPYSCTLTGLKNLTSYLVWIVGSNEAGSGRSDSRSVMPAPVRPGPAREITARPGNFSAVVSWRPPANEGTFPVESYQVWLDGLGAACTVSAPDTSCTITDLVPGKTYTVRVRAWSKAGWGNWAGGPIPVEVTPPAPGIGYPKVRRNRKNPEKMKVTGFTTGVKPGTRLYTIGARTNDEYDRPVVREDGTFIWKATVPVNETWYVLWCVGTDTRGLCSPRTLLIDPTM